MTNQELSKKKWFFPPLNKSLKTKIANSLRISPILSQVLINRGLSDIESAKAFLQSKLSSLSDPMQLPDIEKSSKRILEAIRKGEKITVYGDYDVDGITATALMVQCLELLSKLYGKGKDVNLPNPNIGYYIPDRLEEGYGLNTEAIEMLSRTGTKVIITVDCGVNSFAEAKFAKENGIDLIITDHHEPCLPEQSSQAVEIPDVLQCESVNDVRLSGEQSGSFTQICEDAYGLINPKLVTSAYPFKELSGVGIAFMLAWALGQGASDNKKVANEFKDFLMNAMGLAALGTIADVVPLQRENRILAKYGLSSLQHSEHPGIRALKEVVGLKGKNIKSYHVGFCLSPRINAAGRIGNARIGVEMLTVRSERRAKEIAVYLDNENKRRQKIQSSILESARKKVLDNVDVNSEMAIIVSDDNWHPGVIGIVASRLAEEFYRPVIVIATDKEVGHGSARSIPNFHIHNALVKCQKFSPNKKILISFGGHEQAAGLRVLKKDISEFKKLFNDIAIEQMKNKDLNPTLNVDAEIELSSISTALLRELNRLSPHGEGNQIPLFAARDVRIVGQVSRFGVNGNHLSFYVRQGDVSLRAVAFGMGEKKEMLKKENGNYSIAFVLRDPLQSKINNRQASNYGSGFYKENLELEIKDIST
ncbi:MAG: DHH family phosphoesterase [Candidatus Scalinduaceae bacterium]